MPRSRLEETRERKGRVRAVYAPSASPWSWRARYYWSGLLVRRRTTAAGPLKATRKSNTAHRTSNTASPPGQRHQEWRSPLIQGELRGREREASSNRRCQAAWTRCDAEQSSTSRVGLGRGGQAEPSTRKVIGLLEWAARSTADCIVARGS